jgi:hypothetical protein
MRPSVTCLLFMLTGLASAQDWGNYGGGPARNGRSAQPGPQAADLLWSNTDDPAVISWHPFVEDGRVFTIREAGFPQNGGGANDALVAYDVHTGAELWRTTLPFGGDTSSEWIAWVGGVDDGRVYCSRSSNQQPQPLQAYDAATGAWLWSSAISTEAWAHDGLVFAPDGDVILADRLRVARLDASDGSTVWDVARSCPVSGNCGAAATDTALFIDEAAPGGNIVSKLDLATGATLYSSPIMIGFTDQVSPFLSNDGGTVYFARTQNNPVTDFLFSFEDTGSALVQNWQREVRWTTSHEHGLAADGSIYTFLPDNSFVRLDPSDGSVLDTAGVLSPIGSGNLSPKTAVDKNGNVYVSNGWASTPASDGRLWAFSADLATNLFTLSLDRQNSGGPALGRDGTLLVADRAGVRAYRTPTPWEDLGESLAGSAEPFLVGEGSLLAGATTTLTLSGGVPGGTTALVIGISELNAPFKGGLLVPFAHIVLPGLPLDAEGGLTISFPWPGSMSGDPIWWQHWVTDAGGPLGFAASNAVKSTTP